METQKSTNNSMSSFGLIEKIWSCLIFIKLYSLCISLTPTSVFTEKCVTHSLKMHLHGRMSLYRFFLRFTSCSPWLQEYSDWFLRLSLKLFNAWKINIICNQYDYTKEVPILKVSFSQNVSAYKLIKVSKYFFPIGLIYALSFQEKDTY